MKYLIIQEETPYFSNELPDEISFTDGMIAVDLWERTYTVNGFLWHKIEVK